MKVNGIPLNGPRIVERYLPIQNGAVCFKFRPLKADEDFSEVMPKPKPPTRIAPGGVVHQNTEDPDFKVAVSFWVESKLNWEFLKSVSVTEGLEWSTVDMSKPETWSNWRKECEDNFSQIAAGHIFGGFLEAQYITEEGMEKARATFLTGTPGQQGNPLSPTEGQASTQSGELASV